MNKPFWRCRTVRRMAFAALLALLAALPILTPLLAVLPTARAALVPNPAPSVANLVTCLQPGSTLPQGRPYNSPRFVTTCFQSAWTIPAYGAPGDPAVGDADGTSAAILSFGDDPSDLPGGEQGHLPEAALRDVGAVYGLGFSSGTNPVAPSFARAKRLFAGAYAKRITRFGPGGPGAIYALNRDTGAVTLFVQLSGVLPGPSTLQRGPSGFPNTPGDGASPSFPNAPLPYSPELGGLHSYQHDDAMLPLVGRVGIGDIALDADERYLYAVNLWSRQILRVDTWSAAPQATITPLPDLLAALQPCVSRGGVANYRPFGLHVTTRSVYVGGVCSAETTRNRADLGARVDRFDLLTGTWSNALGFALDDYDAQRGVLPNTTLPLAWQPWSTDRAVIFANGGAAPYPMAAVTGIRVSEANEMFIGLRDIRGDMGGSYRIPDQIGRAFGDVLRALPAGEGRWSAPSTTTEDYIDGDPQLHNEQAWGALAYQPGNPDGAWPGGSLTVTYGAPHRLNSAGAVSYEAGGGGVRPLTREELYDTGQNQSGVDAHTLAKTAGLGDIEPLCPESTIGDRVWLDANGNGVQDAGEQGVPGVRLQLLNSQGQVVATVTTDSQGNYRFYIPAFQTYTLRIDPQQLGTGPLAGLVPTTPNAGGDVAADSNADSQGVVQGLVPTKNHERNVTYDIGLVAAMPGVAVAKGGPASASVGDRIRYTVSVTNTGNVLQRYTVRDALPPGTTFIGASPPGELDSGQLVWRDLGPLAPGAALQILVDVQVEATVADQITNGVTATGSVGGQAQDDHRTEIVRPDLWVRKAISAPGPVPSGSVITYTLELGNRGTGPADQARLDDVVPPQVSGVTWRCVSGCTASGTGNQIQIELGTLVPGAGAQVLVTGVVTTALLQETVTNTAVVSTRTPETDTTNNQSSVSGLVARPDVAVSKDDGRLLVQPGEVLTYTVRITNTGTITVPLATLREVPPAGTAVLARGGWTGQADGSWTQPVGPLAPGQGLTRPFVIQLPIPFTTSAITNTVQADLPGGDPTPGNNTGRDVDQVLRGQVGDTVWRDDNGDGVQQPNEPGLAGIPVQLLDPLTGAVLATTTTDAQGHYRFDGLPLGSYAVRIAPEAMAGQLQNYTPTTPTAPVGTLTPIQPSDLRLDIGVRPPTTTTVQLSYFTVEHGPEGAVVRWGTLAEERTSHFRILRGLTRAQQEAVEIGRVTSLGSRGGDYRLLDPTAPARGARYWLIEVERDGSQNTHGPVVDGAQLFVPLVRR